MSLSGWKQNGRLDFYRVPIVRGKRCILLRSASHSLTNMVCQSWPVTAVLAFVQNLCCFSNRNLYSENSPGLEKVAIYEKQIMTFMFLVVRYFACGFRWRILVWSCCVTWWVSHEFFLGPKKRCEKGVWLGTQFYAPIQASHSKGNC